MSCPTCILAAASPPARPQPRRFLQVSVAGKNSTTLDWFLGRGATSRQRDEARTEKSGDVLTRLVEDLFLSTDLDEILALSDPEGPSDPDAFREAADYVSQWHAALWTDFQQRGDLVRHPASR